ncbi:efflux transporter periplasmic adaptor subunit [Litorivita pollutaquae]|uniref:Efflux transporter periplasmic adaptor subunit n=1 Tax=Litorivita pollutaquae TaxID=2200892 RepID=A0A2V4MXI4_9RHOB|nr:efflux RND transporter periplasmic adaptor subunit [Litorivita pollutaquae]PYC46362.1 efflux transporter periplasmic adaptor subunit [Litorivita pollutaquae]
MIKRLIIAVIVLGLIGVGVVGFNMFRDNMIADIFANRSAPAVPVSTVIADTGEWAPGLEAIGTVYAARGIELSVEAGGIVREVNFRANQRVEEGQVLLTISDTIELAQKAAAVAAQQLAQQSLDRVTSLGERGVAASSAVQEAQANLSSAKAQVKQIQAQIDQKVIKAPFSGEIGIPQVEVGEFVSTGAQIATLQDTSTLRVDFSLPEQQLPRIKAGQQVEVTSEAGALARGRITAIEPQIDPVTRLVSIRAELDDFDSGLNPGQFVRVRISLPVEDGVIALPQTAVVASLYGDHVYKVVSNNKDGEDAGFVTRQVFVETGLHQDDRVEVTKGVAPGDRIVIAGQNRLSSGSPVTLSEAAAAEKGDSSQAKKDEAPQADANDTPKVDTADAGNAAALDTHADEATKAIEAEASE